MSKKSVTPLLAADARAAALHGLSYGMYKALRREAREKEIKRQKRRSKKLKLLKVWEVEVIKQGDGAVEKWSPVLIPECVIEQIKANHAVTDKHGRTSLTVVARHGDSYYDYYIMAPGADRTISALRQGDAVELADLVEDARKVVSRDGSLMDPDYEAEKAFEVTR